MRRIHSFLGAIAYICGRAFKLKRKATPLAISGARLDIEPTFNLAEAAHRVRGSGAGRTVWDMAERLEST